MFDFLEIQQKATKNGTIEIYPAFMDIRSEDLMIRGNQFYAIWDEEHGLWTTDPQRPTELIDKYLWEYYEEHKESLKCNDVRVMTLKMIDSGMKEKWLKYTQRLSCDHWQPLDTKVLFANDVSEKKSYATFKLDYVMEEGSTDCYDKLLNLYFTEAERHKFEWCLGAVVTGEYINIQKFMVLYGPPGCGKSSLLLMIQDMFSTRDGMYYGMFNSKQLCASDNKFALSSFLHNRPIYIEHDGDLSRIEDHTLLNSIVSHEDQVIEEKHKTPYTMRINSFLMMATNYAVKIEDRSQGICRRLIDVNISGKKMDPVEHEELLAKARKFELGAIAKRCADIFRENPHHYDRYFPEKHFQATSDFEGFLDHVMDDILREDPNVRGKKYYEEYKKYSELVNSRYTMSRLQFFNKFKLYFETYTERERAADGKRPMVYRFSGFNNGIPGEVYTDTLTKPVDTASGWIKLENQSSYLDEFLSQATAQYTKNNGTPMYSWDKVKTTLSNIETNKLHYVKPFDLNHIVVDFDLTDENGNKSLEANLKAANEFPETYCECSRSGQGIHLHYIYDGDVERLCSLYKDKIEVKVFTGKSALRRQLSKCNDKEIAHINSGLPTKGDNVKVIDQHCYKNEQVLRACIAKALRKEVHPDTTSNVNYIKMILDRAYESKEDYDVTDMKDDVMSFCFYSTNKAETCLRVYSQMHFQSEEFKENEIEDSRDDITIFDIEVFPNLFILCWKTIDMNNFTLENWNATRTEGVVNPSGDFVRSFMNAHKLVGFNNKKYDNHIIYAASIDYDNQALYDLSQRLVSSDNPQYFMNAFNLSFTDIYDFSGKKDMSLKAWQIKLGLSHVENELPWDQPVPEDRWDEVMGYCKNDVDTTGQVFIELQPEFVARCVLANIADGIPNMSTNRLSEKFIFGKNKTPQGAFQYRNLAEPVVDLDESVEEFLWAHKPEMMRAGTPESKLPYFKGYKFGFQKVYSKTGIEKTIVASIYKWANGQEPYKDFVGEGGMVLGKHGVWKDVALLDVESMHPNSIVSECLFGPTYTERFCELLMARVYIKHEQWDELDKVLDGVLHPYVNDIRNGKLKAKVLSTALKLAINSIYGLTIARHPGPFSDTRNVDNIIAKRGALFMIDLYDHVTDLGYDIIHIKTDSIKVRNADDFIINEVKRFGEQYGYTFVHEASYAILALTTNADYVARYMDEARCQSLYGYVPDDNKGHDGKWTSTGANFKHPYIMAKLFTGDTVDLKDLAITFRSKTSLYSALNVDDLDTYSFIGKISSFVPMREHGYTLLRTGVDKEGNTKYDAVANTKGYLWRDTTTVRTLGWEEHIDYSYYDAMCDDIVNDIEQYMCFQDFIN